MIISHITLRISRPTQNARIKSYRPNFLSPYLLQFPIVPLLQQSSVRIASPQTARGGSTDTCPSSALWRDEGGHKLPTQGQPIAGHQQLLAFPAAPGALLWGAHSPWARTGTGWILLRGVRLWIPWSKSVFIFWRLFAFLCNKNIPNARWVSESQAGRYDSRQGISNRNFESRSMLWVISKRHWCSAGLPVN